MTTDPTTRQPNSRPDKHDPGSLAEDSWFVHGGNRPDATTGAIRTPIVMANSYLLPEDPATLPEDDPDLLIYTRESGANQLWTITPATQSLGCEEHVSSEKSTIRSLLIANRGEVVSRVARTAAKMGIQTIGVYAESDATSPYIGDVDSAVYLGDDSAHSPYIDPDAIILAAKASGADAIHPGYGFLAENAEFAEACIQNELVWVGPTPDSMRAMAGKIRAKEIAREAGVPVLDSIEVGQDLTPVRELAVRVGLPLLLKPSAGGGGKGMHRLDDLDELEEVVGGARREARSSFGDDTLFAERYIGRPRHVEVQVFGDQYGNVLSFGDRDCSIQRRHQKIVEEAPAPGLSHELRDRLSTSAIALARRIGYVGAGTVEYLVFDDQLAFLEMNTRLQVEHPVTEQVTGLDLVELQLRVAAGEPLPMSQADVTLTGHAVEVRLYAEDPANSYMPSPGMVRRLDIPAVPGARWELGVKNGSLVSSRYDPMIAKIISTGADRDEASRKLATVLSRLRVHGVATNRALLRAIVTHDAFTAGDITTAFLDQYPEVLAPETRGGARDFHAIAAALHTAQVVQLNKRVQRFAPYGWRNMRSQDETTLLHAGDEALEVHFRQQRDGVWVVTINEVQHRVRVFGHGAGHIDLEVSGERRRASVSTYANEIVVDTAAGASHFVERTPLDDIRTLVLPEHASRSFLERWSTSR